MRNPFQLEQVGWAYQLLASPVSLTWDVEFGEGRWFYVLLDRSRIEVAPPPASEIDASPQPQHVVVIVAGGAAVCPRGLESRTPVLNFLDVC